MSPHYVNEPPDAIAKLEHCFEMLDAVRPFADPNDPRKGQFVRLWNIYLAKANEAAKEIADSFGV